MLVFKKIIAGIFMVLSVIAIIALIIALFGSWSVKAQLETTTIGLLLTGEQVIATSREGFVRVNDLLDTSTEIVGKVDTTARELKAGVENNERVVAQMFDSVDIDLKQAIENAGAIFNQIDANVVAINDAVDAVNKIPLVNIEDRFPIALKLEEVELLMARLREDVTQFAQTFENRRGELIDGKFGAVTDVTGELNATLEETKSRLAETDMRLEEGATTMAELRARIPALFTTITIVLNLLFLLAILAFISLFLHAWEYFKCTEDGLSGLMPGECEKVPATA